MAKYPLHDEFITKQRRISLGDRALIAIAAHIEVRSVLRASSELEAHGLDDILIGSYARKVAIWPGKDVDVFGRMTTETVQSISPDAAYEMFGRALQPFEAEGRLRRQPRSFKVEFSPQRTPAARFIQSAARDYAWASTRVDRVLAHLERLAFMFSVDVVPAVAWDSHYGILELDDVSATGERFRTGHWCRTDPVQLTDETWIRNREPRIASAGAFVRTVKAIRQIKAHYLANSKPSSLYFELVLHEGFTNGSIDGDSWADINASALSYVATRLTTVGNSAICDPILGEPYRPIPSASDVAAARTVFEEQARRARRAVTADSRCQAGIEWRQVFGGNEQHDTVFPLPTGCRGTGVAMGAAATNLATGGSQERSFGSC